jgi:RimJ/RimL family protein N-acetyltransferase
MNLESQSSRVFETERLALRWLEAADAGFLHELMNDPDWLRYIGDRGIRSVEDARNHIVNGPREMYARSGFGLHLVELQGTSAALGVCGLIKRDWLADVDLGFAFLARHRGAGYAFEAASATRNYARSTLRLDRIVAIVSPENLDSIRLLTKLGMTLERMVKPPGETREVGLFATSQGFAG